MCVGCDERGGCDENVVLPFCLLFEAFVNGVYNRVNWFVMNSIRYLFDVICVSLEYTTSRTKYYTNK